MPISSALGSSALLPGSLGFRNKIINGDFRINQRGLTSTGTVNGAAIINGGLGFDRWVCNLSGGTVTFSAQTFTAGNEISGQEPTNFFRIVTSGQSAGNYAQFAQKIEDVRTCAGQQVVISFWAKASSALKVAIELQQNFGTGGSPSAGVLTYGGQVTLTTSWVRYFVSVNVPSIAGKTLGTNNDHFFSFAPLVSAGTGFESRTGSLGVQNGTFDFWGVQLEQNYQPTPFEQRPYGVELQLCQRYYQMFGTLDIEFIANTSVNYIANYTFFEMRVNPTITQPSMSATNAASTPTLVIQSKSTLRLVFVPNANSYARAIATTYSGLSAEL